MSTPAMPTDGHILDVVDDLMVRLNCGTLIHWKDAVKGTRIRIEDFRGCEVFIPGTEITSNSRLFLREFRDMTPDSIGNIDVSIIQEATQEVATGSPGCRYQASRIRTVPTHIFRKMIGNVATRHVVESRVAYFHESGAVEGGRLLWALVAGKWVSVWPNRLAVGVETGRRDDERIRAFYSVALTRRYEWHVHLRYEDCIPLSFATDPIGAREVFRLRDIPNGRTRRAALRNWVSEHWRKSRGSEETDRSFVRAHLRGAEEFSWRGLYCRIVPSDFDIALERKKKEERDHQ